MLMARYVLLRQFALIQPKGKMKKHAQIGRKNSKKLLGGLTALLLVAIGVAPTSATSAVDVAGLGGNFSESFVSIVSFGGNGTVITYVTGSRHYFQPGDRISISIPDRPNSSGENLRVHSVLSSTTFQVLGTAQDADQGTGYATKVGRRIAFSTLRGDGTTITVTAENHGLQVGDTAFEINSGYHFYEYGTKTITAVTANSFSFAGTETQGRDNGTVRLNVIGSRLDEDHPIYFRNVFVTGGRSIHASVTLTDANGIVDRAATAGNVSALQYPQADSSENEYLNKEILFASATNRFAEFTVKFFEGVPSSVNAVNAAAVTLANVTATVYDVDARQFVEFTNVRSEEPLDPMTILFRVPVSSGVVRFQSSSSSTSGADSFTRGRATVTLSDTSTFVYTVGISDPGSAGSASFILDLSSGQRVVTFDSNNGVGSMTAQVAGSATALTSNAFTRTGFTFAGWNTAADGSGTSYSDSASFPFTANTTLYAQWATPQAAAPTAAPSPYSGPIPMNLSTIPAETPTEATLTGERLNLITGAAVNGKPVTLKPISATTKGLVFPALPAGTYDVIFTYQGGGTITQQAGLRVTPSSAVAAPQPGQFSAQRLFANYRGDRGPVIARDRAAISAFINQYKGITTVRCVGSTSGVPAKRTDPAPAAARARNACDIVKRLVPNATISLETSTGKGIGQRFRSVTIFISGSN